MNIECVYVFNSWLGLAADFSDDSLHSYYRMMPSYRLISASEDQLDDGIASLVTLLKQSANMTSQCIPRTPEWRLSTLLLERQHAGGRPNVKIPSYQ